MKKNLFTVSVVSASLLLGSCVTNGTGTTAGSSSPSNETLGTVLGGLAGMAAGAAFGKGSGKAAAILIGGGLGALIGNRIGAGLDEIEKRALSQASQNAAEVAKTGQRIEWNAAPIAQTSPTAPAAPISAASAQDTSKAAAPTAAAPSKKVSAVKTAPAPVVAAAPADVPTAAGAGKSASGWVIPTSDVYQTAQGRTCRNMHQVAVKDGQQAEDDVTLCRQTDSSGAAQWVIPTQG